MSRVLVEHGDALAGMVERVLQEVAVVLDGRGGIVEELQRRLGRRRCAAAAAATGPAATRPRRWPRRAGARRSAAGGCRPRRVPLERQRRGWREALERARRCAPRRDSGATVARSSSTVTLAAPEPEARRHADGRSRDEGIGLQPLDRRRRPRQREADVERDVDRRGSRATPWVSGAEGRSRAARCGLSAPMPNGPMPMRLQAGSMPCRRGWAAAACRPRRRCRLRGRRVAPSALPRRQNRPPKKAGRDLRDGRERDQADGGERRRRPCPVIGVGEQQDDRRSRCAGSPRMRPPMSPGRRPSTATAGAARAG